MTQKITPDLRDVYEQQQHDVARRDQLKRHRSEDGSYLLGGAHNGYVAWHKGWMDCLEQLQRGPIDLSKEALLQAKTQFDFVDACNGLAVLDPLGLSQTRKAVDTALAAIEKLNCGNGY